MRAAKAIKVILTVPIIYISLTCCLISQVRGFGPPFLKFVPRRQTNRATINDELDFDDLFSTSKGLELWLDLRRTAIHPRAAIDYLDGQLSIGNDDSFPSSIVWDRVVLTDKGFQNLVKAKDAFVQDYDILYSPSEDPTSIALSHEGISFPFGEFLLPNGSVAVTDPLRAMEVLSEGKWAILGANEANSGENEPFDAAEVGNFLEIVSTATHSTTQSESGLVLKVENNYADAMIRDEEKGGIAVFCSTKSSIVELASVVQSLQSGKSTTFTESGILIQTTGTEKLPYLSIALMLPFDVSLVETALTYTQK